MVKDATLDKGSSLGAGKLKEAATAVSGRLSVLPIYGVEIESKLLKT